MVSGEVKNGFGKLEARVRRRLLCSEQGSECLLKILYGVNPSHKAEVGCNWLQGQQF